MRTIECPWLDYHDLAQGILGQSYVAVGPPITTIDASAAGSNPNPFPWFTPGYKYVGRYTPWSFPSFVNRSYKRYLWACSAEIEGRGVPLDSNQIFGSGNDAESLYKNARLTVQFDTRLYDIMDDATFIGVTNKDVDEGRLIRYVTKIYRPQGEFLVLEGNAYFYAGLTFDGGARPLTKGVNKTVVSYNISLTWHFIPEEGVPSIFFNSTAPNIAIDRCLGRVNNDTFHGARKGTLLLMAAELKPQISAFGDRTYDITYMFKFLNPSQTEYFGNVPGHNHIFRPFGANATPTPTNGWYEAVASESLSQAATPTNFVAMANDINIYNFADFRTLFRPATWSL